VVSEEALIWHCASLQKKKKKKKKKKKTCSDSQMRTHRNRHTRQ